MITTVIGKIFLSAYNQRYKQHYDAQTFFDDVYFPLFFDSNKYMQWVQNSPFVQMKSGQKVDKLTALERKEKLSALHEKIADGAVDASVAIGYAASESKEFATTSGQVTDIDFSISPEDVYYSWIGSGLGIGLQGGYSILFSESDILLDIFEGWQLYRILLEKNEKLKGNQIGTWNGQWLTHRYDSFIEGQPMANFDPFEVKNDQVSIKTQSWTKLLIGLAKRYKSFQMIGYVYSFGQMNTTVGFIPFILSEIRRPIDLYKTYFGMSHSSEAETLWGTEFGFKTCCQSGAIGVKAMAPKGVLKYVKDGVLPKLKKENEKQELIYQTYIIWILAMLNNEQLWDLSQEFAQVLHDYISQDSKKLNKQKTNQVEAVLKSTTKKTFIDSLVDIVKDTSNKESISSIAKEVNAMPTDNVPYFLTLVRFNYVSLI